MDHVVRSYGEGGRWGHAVGTDHVVHSYGGIHMFSKHTGTPGLPAGFNAYELDTELSQYA